MLYDEIKVDKLRDFVAAIENGGVEVPDSTELVRRVKAQILWLEQKVEEDKLKYRLVV